MPNTKSPITSINRAISYRQSIVEALPKSSKFEPLMTIYLTDDTDKGELINGFKKNVFFVINSSPFQMIFFPSDRSDESKTNSDIGKSRCSRIFSNSDPTAPEEPKTATFNGLLGKYWDCLTL